MKRLPVDIPTAKRPLALAALSHRELEVLQLLARRMSTTQMATAMSITVNTVRTRVRGAQRKLGANGREEAAQTARYLGLP
jgi:LuxR family maltose regulon positive regulatory protein